MSRRTFKSWMLWSPALVSVVAVLVLAVRQDLSVVSRLALGAAALLFLGLSVWQGRRLLVLMEAEAGRLSQIVDFSPQGVMVFRRNAQGELRIDRVNDAARMALGGGLGLERGRSLLSALPGFDSHELATRLTRLGVADDVVNEDNFLYESEGGSFSGIFDVLAFPLDAHHVVVLLSDVSSRNLLAETVRRRESELELVFDSAVDAILIGDSGGRYLFANPATCGLTGYTVGELHAMKLAHLVADASPAQMEILAPQPADEASGFVEADMRRKDGSQYPAEIAVQWLPDGRQLTVIRDITERKRAEESLRLAAVVFTQAREAILITNTHGVILQVNDAFCSLTGYRRDEVLGRSPNLLSSGRHDRAFFADLWDQLLINGRWSGEIWNKRKNGEQFVQLMSISAVRGGEGEVLHYIGMSFDITQRKADELALVRHRDHLQELVAAQVVDLVRAKEEAERANRVKTEFLANMSHELRTPMHAILGFSELGQALPAGQGAKAAEYFDAVHRSGRRLLHLIDDLLDLAKLEAGRIVPKWEKVALDRIVGDVLSELLPLADKRRVELRLALAADCSLPCGDGARLAQVVRNLLSNAIRFSPDGGVVELAIVETTLAARTGAPEGVPALRLVVADGGPGIPAAELELIFDKFYQSSRTRDGAGGTGLGLAICREIVDMHRGRIAASNRPEGGALFEVILPRWSEESS